MGIDTLVNAGGAPVDRRGAPDHPQRRDTGRASSREGHVLNAMSSAIFTGFRKEFTKDGSQYTGITSDTDGRIRAATAWKRFTWTRPPGRWKPGDIILLRYLDPPWQGFYDIFKSINDDLLIGRVYLGQYPNGARVVHLPHVAPLRLRADDGGRPCRALCRRSRAHRRRSGRRLAHGHDLQRQPRRRGRLSAVRLQARRAPRGALSAHGSDGRTGRSRPS